MLFVQLFFLIACFEGGNTFVSSTVAKDGHTFSIHVIDPKSDEELRAARECELPEAHSVAGHDNLKVPKDHLAQNSARKTRKSEETIIWVPY